MRPHKDLDDVIAAAPARESIIARPSPGSSSGGGAAEHTDGGRCSWSTVETFTVTVATEYKVQWKPSTPL